MENCKAIILCAGEASRWGNHLNTPKHLIELEGEKLLHRTIRLLKDRGIDEIYTVVKDITGTYYHPDSVQWVAKIDYENNADADKFLSSKDLWNDKGRTIVLYGDVYFTNEAIDTILSFSDKEWTLFAREGASSITGTPWGECFALSFYPKDHKRMEEMLHYIATLWKTGVIKRCGGWELYRAMTGRRDKKVRHPHTITTNFVEINDFTEDFDRPEDLDMWLKNRAKTKRICKDMV